MALRLDYYHPGLDLVISNVYWRLNPYNGIYGGTNGITYTINGFKNKAAADANGFTIETVQASFVPVLTGSGSTDIVKQIYTHAKTLPFFSGSTDA
jgi:hypothetical protein